jgi:hypothetical protein
MAAPVIPAITDGLANFLQPKWHRVLVEVGSEIEDLWRPIFNFDPDMSWSPMQEAQVSGLGPLVKKPQGQGFSYDSLIEGGSVTYTAETFGLGFEWTIEMVRFDLFGMFDDVAADLVRGAPYRIELEAWALVNDAFDGNLFTGFDGLSLAHAAHPYLQTDLGTFSNKSATNIALSQAGIQEALLYYNTSRDMRGMPNRRRPALALIKPDRIPAAREVLQSEYDPRSANNAVNTIVDDQLKYYASRYLTSASAWHLISRPQAGNRGHDAWVRFAIPPTPDQFDDRRTRSSVQTMLETFAVGFGSVFGWWSSAGNGS